MIDVLQRPAAALAAAFLFDTAPLGRFHAAAAQPPR
jgi:hypothetical protein